MLPLLFQSFLLAIPITLIVYFPAKWISGWDVEARWKVLLAFFILFSLVYTSTIALYLNTALSCFNRPEDAVMYVCDFGKNFSVAASRAFLPSVLISTTLLLFALVGVWVSGRVSINNELLRYFLATWVATFLAMVWVVLFPWWLASLFY